MDAINNEHQAIVNSMLVCYPLIDIRVMVKIIEQLTKDNQQAHAARNEQAIRVLAVQNDDTSSAGIQTARDYGQQKIINLISNRCPLVGIDVIVKIIEHLTELNERVLAAQNQQLRQELADWSSA